MAQFGKDLTTPDTNGLTQEAQADTLRGLVAELEDYLPKCKSPSKKKLVEGYLCHLRGDAGECVSRMERACELIADGDSLDFPDLDSPYTVAYVAAQLRLSRSSRPVMEKGSGLFAGNIEALKKVDAPLAQEVDQAMWPDSVELVKLWKNHYFFSVPQHVIYSLSDNLREGLSCHLKEKKRSPVTFGRICTGQEVLYCLENRVDLLHGMSRVDYLFEPDTQMIRALFHLADFSEVLGTRELIIFGGSTLAERSKRILSTFRYPLPSFIVGDVELVKGCVEEIKKESSSTDPSEKVKAYYSASEFLERKKLIAEGKVMPRISVITCRWTTFHGST